MVAKSASPDATQILSEFGFGEIPSDWSVVRIEDLLSDDRGISVGVMYPGEHSPSGTPLIKAGDLAGNRINPRPDFRITQEKHHEYRRTALSGDELLISLVGDIGRCAIVPPNMAGWNAARAIAVLRFKDKADAEFSRICLMSPFFQHLMRAWATTTVQATLNLKEIRQIPLPWPEIKQREAIVRILGALDDKVELNRHTSETLEAMSRALFKSWFVDFDGVAESELVESEMGLIPRGWRSSTIGAEVAVLGGSTPSTKEAAFWDGGTYHWVTPKDLSALTFPVLLDTERKITDAGLAKITSGMLPAGTVLLSSRAPIGYLAITEIPTAINQGFIAMKCDGALSNVFVLQWCRSNMDAIIGNANGSTFLEISKSNFRPLPVVVPSESVMIDFSTQAEALHRRLVNNERESRTLAQLRDALLPKLLSGELRVKDAEKLAGDAA